MAEISLSQSVLAAFIIVMLISVAFMSHAEEDDEGGEFTRAQGVFTYSVSMDMDGAVHNGTYVLDTLSREDELTWENESFAQLIDEGRQNGTAFMFLHTWQIGFFPTMIDKVSMETPWGEKKLDRSLILWPDMEGGFLMNVVYGGGNTLTNYRQDIISERWRATFLLTDLVGTDIASEDREWSDRAIDIGNSRQHYGKEWSMLGEDEMRLMRTDGKVYNVSVRNYAYYHFSQDIMMDMFEGGLLRYDQERSVIGNGSVEFELDGRWYLRVIVPVGDQPHVFTMETRD